jgi:hypothetical protein
MEPPSAETDETPRPAAGSSTSESATLSPSGSMPYMLTGITTVWPAMARALSTRGCGARLVPASSTVTATEAVSMRSGWPSR